MLDYTVDKLQETLIKILKNNGIKNNEVLQAFSAIQRYDFIKDYIKNEKDLYNAYFNPFPIGFEQTISQPLICAIMVESLEIKNDNIILEIGTGSGYLTALLAQLAKEVYTVDINDTLLSQAKNRLEKIGLKNIHYYAGNGLLGINNMLFDRIVISAALKNSCLNIVNSLKVGGIMIFPLELDENNENQKLMKITKTPDKLIEEFICYCRFVPIQNKAQN